METKLDLEKVLFDYQNSYDFYLEASNEDKTNYYSEYKNKVLASNISDDDKSEINDIIDMFIKDVVKENTAWDYEELIEQDLENLCDNLSTEYPSTKYRVTPFYGSYFGTKEGLAMEFDTLKECIEFARSSNKNITNFYIRKSGNALMFYGVHHDATDVYTIERHVNEYDVVGFFKPEVKFTKVMTFLVNGNEVSQTDFYETMREQLESSDDIREEVLADLESEYGDYIEIGQMNIPLRHIVEDLGNEDFEEMIADYCDSKIDDIQNEIAEKFEEADEMGTIYSNDDLDDEFTVTISTNVEEEVKPSNSQFVVSKLLFINITQIMQSTYSMIKMGTKSLVTLVKSS